MTEGPQSPDELRAYFRAVGSALAALERRLVARGEQLTGDEALEEVRRYRAVVRENLATLDSIAEAPPGGTPPVPSRAP